MHFMSTGKRREGPLRKVMTRFPKLKIQRNLGRFSLENGQAVDVLHLVLTVLGEIIWLLPWLLICCVSLVTEGTEVSLGCAQAGEAAAPADASAAAAGLAPAMLEKSVFSWWKPGVCPIPAFSSHLEDCLKARNFYIPSFLKSSRIALNSLCSLTLGNGGGC